MTDVRPTIAAQAITKLLALLPSLGLDVPEVCAAASFDPRICQALDARVPLAALHALWEAVAARCVRADLAAAIAERYQPGDYGLVGFVAMSSPTLGDALVQVERYMGLWTDDPGLRLHDDGRVEVVYRTQLVERRGLHLATEATLTEVLHASRLVAQRRLIPREVRFRHPAPDIETGRASVEDFFGVPPRFDAQTTWIHFDPADLTLPLPRGDVQLGAFLRHLATDALVSRASPDTLGARLHEILAEELRWGIPSIDVVAHRLGMSSRTLRRRLDEEGTTFRDAIDETRAAMARAYVRDRRMPLTEVSFLLGFSEPSAFHRAFKRWTGSTPGAFRQGTN